MTDMRRFQIARTELLYASIDLLGWFHLRFRMPIITRKILLTMYMYKAQ